MSRNYYRHLIEATPPPVGPLFPNAVAYYKLDETSGQAIDGVNAHNASLFGGVTQGVTGKIGTAYSFDGLDDYLEIPLSIYNDFDNKNFTVSFWFKTNDVTKPQLIISDLRGGQFVERKVYVYVDNSKLGYGFGDGGSNQVINGITTLQNNLLYHVIIKREENGDVVLKLNNSVEGIYTLVTPSNTTSNIINVGRRNDDRFYFYGTLDEVVFINGITTLQQDNDLFNNQRSIL